MEDTRKKAPSCWNRAMPEAMRHTDQGYLSMFLEEHLRKAASSFFSLTDFPSEIKWAIQEKEIRNVRHKS